MSAILGPPFWKIEIRCQIRNQWPQKPWSTKFHENRWVLKILCPPYWVRHFEFRKSDVKFIIRGPKSFWVQSFAEIVWPPKLHVRHIGYPPFCEGYGYLRSVRQFFSCRSTIPITVDHSYDQVPIQFWLEKKLWKKNSQLFGTFLQIWRHIGFPIGRVGIFYTKFHFSIDKNYSTQNTDTEKIKRRDVVVNHCYFGYVQYVSVKTKK